MLKLIIADDERVIRETISSLIDWNEMGIDLIGVCKDGIEAYNMILDESPDIVMTDIRMPGLSGIELVREVTQASQEIQFIILSGYDEFEYARELMKYGVKHYLLKPCSEQAIMESVRQIVEECNKKKQHVEEEKKQNHMQSLIRQDAMYHMLIDGLSMKEMEGNERHTCLEEQIKFYDEMYQLNQGTYYLYYVYYLEWENLEYVLREIELKEKQKSFPQIFYGIYVNNVLLLLCNELLQKKELQECCEQFAPLTEISVEKHQNLLSLLERVFEKICRYDTIYVVHNFQIMMIVNDKHIVRHMQNCRHNIESSDEKIGLIPKRVMEYVEEHLQDTNLTLKKVAEEYLFMNVDYVSRQFKKATNKKFSQYLTEQRVKRAKEILLREKESKIQYVAQQVGCGNNPQYFSQIFKKVEGTTPAKWLEQVHNNKK